MKTLRIKFTMAALGLLLSSTAMTLAVQITYNVDMSVYQAVGLFNPTNGDTVWVGGSPFGWANPPTFQLTNNPIGSTIYSGTANDTSDSVGSTEYHEIDFYTALSVPGLNYGVGYTYGPTYSLVVPATPTNLPTVFFNDESTTNAYIRSQVTFQLNMSVQIALGNFQPNNGDTVVVDGGLDGWSDSAMPLTVSANTNIYVGTFTIPGFTNQPPFAYSFVYKNGSGDNWEASNRHLSLTNSTQVVSAYYNNEANTQTPVTFQVNMATAANLGLFIPGTDFVVISGTANNWAYNWVLTNSLINTNIYYGTFIDPDLPGTVESYSYVIDGVNSGWYDSYAIPANAGGQQGNRTFTVASPSQTLPLVYYCFQNLGVLSCSPVSSSHQITNTWNVALNGANGAGIYLETAGGLNGPWQAVPGTTDAGIAPVNVGTTNAFFRLAGPP